MAGLSQRIPRGAALISLGLAVLVLAGAATPAITASATPSPSPSASPSPATSPGDPSTAPASPPIVLSLAPIDLDTPLLGPGVLPTDQLSADLVQAIHTPTFGHESRLATARALASVGIGVLDQATLEPIVPLDGTPSPMRFLDWQLHALALEAWAGSGISGTELDAAAPVPDDAPLASSIVAGWIAAADSPAGRLGRALMAGQDVTDPTQLVVPSMVLALLAADLAADQPAARSGGAATVTYASGSLPLGGPALLAAAPGAGGICTSAQTFIDDVIGAVFAALHATPPRDGVGRVIVSVWNWLVDQGRDFVRTVAGKLTAPVVGTIRLVAGTLATIAHAVSALVPYTVVVVAMPVPEIDDPARPGTRRQGLLLRHRQRGRPARLAGGPGRLRQSCRRGPAVLQARWQPHRLE